MTNPDDRYRRWLDEEAQARRLAEQRRAARRRCDRALSASASGGAGGRASLAESLEELERAVEASLAFYLGHTANDADFLRRAFGASRARQLAKRLEERKLALMNELDGVREMRRRLTRARRRRA